VRGREEFTTGGTMTISGADDEAVRAPGDVRRNVVRAGVRGLVAAMAMTGFRTVSGVVDPGQQSPPRAVVEKHGPRRVRRLPPPQREAITELAHWAYGMGCGALFGLLPRSVRAHRLLGPGYGLAVWLVFDAAVAPMMGLRDGRYDRPIWRIGVALDHLLYGVVVAGRLPREA
jgi:hypothetical protein